MKLTIHRRNSGELSLERWTRCRLILGGTPFSLQVQEADITRAIPDGTPNV